MNSGSSTVTWANALPVDSNTARIKNNFFILAKITGCSCSASGSVLQLQKWAAAHAPVGIAKRHIQHRQTAHDVSCRTVRPWMWFFGDFHWSGHFQFCAKIQHYFQRTHFFRRKMADHPQDYRFWRTLLVGIHCHWSSNAMIVVVEPCVIQPPFILLIPATVRLFFVLLAVRIVTESSSDYHYKK